MTIEFNKEGIYFVALGGAEEVGYNMFAYIIDGKIIVVDTGYGFLQDDFPGMEMGLADAAFLENYRESVEAIFITHGHEDHFGAIAHILPRLNCPVYASNFALGHIKSRLKEYKLDNFYQLNSITENPKVHLNGCSVEYVSLVHSVPQSAGLIIRTPYGNIFHATDWRFDDGKTSVLPTDNKALNALAKEGVSLYVGDSTNMSSTVEEPSEAEVRNSLLKLVPQLKNTIVATCFSSNIVRLESLILAAESAGRTAVISGHSLNQNYKIACECGYLQDCPKAFDYNDVKDIPLDKILFICAGSQGDYRSALSRIAKGESKDIVLGKGDNIIFSSKIIPGNEEKIERLQERLRDLGVDVISTEDYPVHASGHATPAQILQMYRILKPQTVIPVHGDKRNIRKQKKLAAENGVGNVLILRNGEVALINQSKSEIIGEIPTGKIGVDRGRLIPLDAQVIKNRKRIAFNCSVFISVVFGSKWELKDVQITSIDILEEDDFVVLKDKIIKDLKEDIAKEVIKHNHNEHQIKEYLAARIRKQIFKATEIKPVVFFHYYKESSDV